VGEAKPKKLPGEDYYRVASQGVLYLVVRRALEDIGLEADHVGSKWIGYEKSINYCGWYLRAARFSAFTRGIWMPLKNC